MQWATPDQQLPGWMGRDLSNTDEDTEENLDRKVRARSSSVPPKSLVERTHESPSFNDGACSPNDVNSPTLDDARQKSQSVERSPRSNISTNENVRPIRKSLLQKQTSMMFQQYAETGPPKPRNPLFADTDAIKSNILQKIADKHNAQDVYHEFGCFQRIARNQLFENITLAVIGLNSVWIAIDADYNHAENLWEADWPFAVTENMFCSFFFAELAIRFCAFELKKNAFVDAWFVFDSALVFLMVLETWVAPAVYFVFKVTFKAGSMLAILRLVRLSRVARMARLMRSFPELLLLAKGIVVAIRSVFFTLLLLLCVVYVFSIAFRQLSQGTILEREQLFTDVPRAFFTLVSMGLYMDSVYDLMRFCSQAGIGYVFLLCMFLFLAAHTILNLLLGVLCSVVTVISVTEKWELLVLYAGDRMMWILAKLGLDPEAITKRDFLSLVQDSDVIDTMQEIDVDPAGLVDVSDVIFQGTDFRDKESLALGEILDVVLSFRGSNNATVKDLVYLRKFIVSQFATLTRKLDDLRKLVDHASQEDDSASNKNTSQRLHRQAEETSAAGEKSSQAPRQPPRSRRLGGLPSLPALDPVSIKALSQDTESLNVPPAKLLGSDRRKGEAPESEVADEEFLKTPCLRPIYSGQWEDLPPRVSVDVNALDLKARSQDVESLADLATLLHGPTPEYRGEECLKAPRPPPYSRHCGEPPPPPLVDGKLRSLGAASQDTELWRDPLAKLLESSDLAPLMESTLRTAFDRAVQQHLFALEGVVGAINQTCVFIQEVLPQDWMRLLQQEPQEHISSHLLAIHQKLLDTRSAMPCDAPSRSSRRSEQVSSVPAWTPGAQDLH